MNVRFKMNFFQKIISKIEWITKLYFNTNLYNSTTSNLKKEIILKIINNNLKTALFYLPLEYIICSLVCAQIIYTCEAIPVCKRENILFI